MHRSSLILFVALWSGDSPVQRITSSEEHNGCATRQECVVTFLKCRPSVTPLTTLLNQSWVWRSRRCRWKVNRIKTITRKLFILVNSGYFCKTNISLINYIFIFFFFFCKSWVIYFCLCSVSTWLQKQLCGRVHVNRGTSDHPHKGGKWLNTSLNVQLCLWGTTAARTEQSYLTEPGPSEDFLHHWHCEKGTHLIPAIVSDAVGNATDRMDFQHLTSATMPLRPVEKKENKRTGRSEVWHNDLQVTPSSFKVQFYGKKSTLPKNVFTIIDKDLNFKVTFTAFV